MRKEKREEKVKQGKGKWLAFESQLLSELGANLLGVLLVGINQVRNQRAIVLPSGVLLLRFPPIFGSRSLKQSHLSSGLVVPRSKAAIDLVLVSTSLPEAKMS